MQVDEQFTLYRITNDKNGKIYIGMTVKSPAERLRSHIAASKRGSVMVLHRAMRKHGHEFFKIVSIAVENTRAAACEREIALIAELRSTDSTVGYNTSRGGDGGQGFTDATRSKIKTALTGRKLSMITRERMSVAHRGHTQSEVTRARIGAVIRGKKQSTEHKARNVEARRMNRAHVVGLHARLLALRLLAMCYSDVVEVLQNEFGLTVTSAQAKNIVSRHTRGLCGACRVAAVQPIVEVE